MAEAGSDKHLALDTEIEQLKRAIETLREYTSGKPVRDGSWSALERAEGRLGELLHSRSQFNQLDGSAWVLP
ncbi:hypothetical protein [Methylobacterium sp. CM6246]